MFNSFPSPFPDSGGGVKSIQRGEASIASGQLLVDVPISEVNVTKSVPRISYTNAASQAANATCVKARLINNNTLRLERATATADVVTITWQVVEYVTLRSLQSGTFAKANGSSTLAISPVNLSKAELVFSHTMDAVNTGIRVGALTGKLSTSAEITFVASADPGNRSIDWYVVEFP